MILHVHSYSLKFSSHKTGTCTCLYAVMIVLDFRNLVFWGVWVFEGEDGCWRLGYKTGLLLYNLWFLLYNRYHSCCIYSECTQFHKKIIIISFIIYWDSVPVTTCIMYIHNCVLLFLWINISSFAETKHVNL